MISAWFALRAITSSTASNSTPGETLEIARIIAHVNLA